MRAGRLRHYVTLQRLDTSGTDAAGDPQRAWVDVEQVYAAIEPPTMTAITHAQVAVKGGARVGTDLRLVTLHPYPGVATETWRVVDAEGRVYMLIADRTTNAESEMVFLTSIGGV